MSSPVTLAPECQPLVLQALKLLASSMARSAKAATNPEIRALYERDKARVEALIVSFS